MVQERTTVLIYTALTVLLTCCCTIFISSNGYGYTFGVIDQNFGWIPMAIVKVVPTLYCVTVLLYSLYRQNITLVSIVILFLGAIVCLVYVYLNASLLLAWSTLVDINKSMLCFSSGPRCVCIKNRDQVIIDFKVSGASCSSIPDVYLCLAVGIGASLFYALFCIGATLTIACIYNKRSRTRLVQPRANQGVSQLKDILNYRSTSLLTDHPICVGADTMESKISKDNDKDDAHSLYTEKDGEKGDFSALIGESNAEPTLPTVDLTEDPAAQSGGITGQVSGDQEPLAKSSRHDNSLDRPMRIDPSLKQHAFSSPISVDSGYPESSRTKSNPSTEMATSEPDQETAETGDKLFTETATDGGQTNHETEPTIMVTMSGSQSIEILPTRSKQKLHSPWQLWKEIPAHQSGSFVPCTAIDPAGSWFATGSSDSTIRIFDVAEALPRLRVQAHKGTVRALTFGATSHRYLYSCADDIQMLCHDIEVNQVVSRFPEQQAVLYCMSMFGPSETLFTGGRDKIVRMWDTRTVKCVRKLRGHSDSITGVVTSMASKQLVTTSLDSTMRIWDAGDGRCVQVISDHVKSIKHLAIHPNNLTLISTTSEKLHRWRLPDCLSSEEYPITGSSINCTAVNRNGTLVGGGSQGILHFWDMESGVEFQKMHRNRAYNSYEVPICISSIMFDQVGNKLIVTDASHVVKVYQEVYTKVRRRLLESSK